MQLAPCQARPSISVCQESILRQLVQAYQAHIEAKVGWPGLQSLQRRFVFAWCDWSA